MRHIRFSILSTGLISLVTASPGFSQAVKEKSLSEAVKAVHQEKYNIEIEKEKAKLNEIQTQLQAFVAASADERVVREAEISAALTELRSLQGANMRLESRLKLANPRESLASFEKRVEEQRRQLLQEVQTALTDLHTYFEVVGNNTSFSPKEISPEAETKFCNAFGEALGAALHCDDFGFAETQSKLAATVVELSEEYQSRIEGEVALQTRERLAFQEKILLSASSVISDFSAENVLKSATELNVNWAEYALQVQPLVVLEQALAINKTAQDASLSSEIELRRLLGSGLDPERARIRGEAQIKENELGIKELAKLQELSDEFGEERNRIFRENDHSQVITDKVVALHTRIQSEKAEVRKQYSEERAALSETVKESLRLLETPHRRALVDEDSKRIQLEIEAKNLLAQKASKLEELQSWILAEQPSIASVEEQMAPVKAEAQNVQDLVSLAYSLASNARSSAQSKLDSRIVCSLPMLCPTAGENSGLNSPMALLHRYGSSTMPFPSSDRMIAIQTKNLLDSSETTLAKENVPLGPVMLNDEMNYDEIFVVPFLEGDESEE